MAPRAAIKERAAAGPNKRSTIPTPAVESVPGQRNRSARAGAAGEATRLLKTPGVPARSALNTAGIPADAVADVAEAPGAEGEAKFGANVCADPPAPAAVGRDILAAAAACAAGDPGIPGWLTD